MKNVRWGTVLIIITLSLNGCCWCWPSGGSISSRIAQGIGADSVRRTEQQIQLNHAEHVEATIRFGGGNLDIEPLEIKALGPEADPPLLQARFTYNVDDLKPVVDYQVQGGQGELEIRHETDNVRLDRLTTELRNEWELALCDCVPLSLNLDVGASNGRFDLGGLRIERLDLTLGAADLTVSFDKLNPERLRSIQVLGGAARLDMNELGNANLDELTFDGGLGTYSFDLTGEWQRSANIHIQAGASQVRLYVPRDIGVRICPGDLPRAHYGGLKEQDGCYTNTLYGQSDIMVEVRLDLGMGRLDVKQVN
jgi:hypothetical protein